MLAWQPRRLAPLPCFFFFLLYQAVSPGNSNWRIAWSSLTPLCGKRPGSGPPEGSAVLLISLFIRLLRMPTRMLPRLSRRNAPFTSLWIPWLDRCICLCHASATALAVVSKEKKLNTWLVLFPNGPLLPLFRGSATPTPEWIHVQVGPWRCKPESDFFGRFRAAKVETVALSETSDGSADDCWLASP